MAIRLLVVGYGPCASGLMRRAGNTRHGRGSLSAGDSDGGPTRCWHKAGAKVSGVLGREAAGHRRARIKRGRAAAWMNALAESARA
ncbi:hypothetical protein CDD83_9737 [Cordyceps sp. RAO-2017]|nr:hypothetical protein CDD83_9737 [Cordyceps sp. RAO-2017]